LIVRQVNGIYKVKDANLQKLHARVSELLKSFSYKEINYLPRAQNKKADALVNKALDERSGR